MSTLRVFDLPHRHLNVTITVESTMTSSVMALMTILVPDFMFDQISFFLELGHVRVGPVANYEIVLFPFDVPP